MGEVIPFPSKHKAPAVRVEVEEVTEAPPLPEGEVVEEGVDTPIGGQPMPWLLYADGTKVYPSERGHLIFKPAKA